MVKNVKAECHPTTNIDGIIKRWLNSGQKVVASKGPKGGWFWLRQYGYYFTTTADVTDYALSPLVDTSKLITIYDTASPQTIRPMSEQSFRNINPGPTATGTPYLYTLKGFSPVQNQPSSASVLTFVSSSGSDTSVVVNVQGLDASNVLVGETVTLNGTSSVSTTLSYSKVMILSKSDKSVGKVTCTSNSGGVTNVVISPYDRHVSHPVIGLFNIPDSTDTIYYDFTMKLQNIYDDNDISLIPEQYHDVPELYAKHRCFKHLNNTAMAQMTLQELELRIKEMQDDYKQPNGVFSVNSVCDNSIFTEARLPIYFPAGS